MTNRDAIIFSPGWGFSEVIEDGHGKRIRTDGLSAWKAGRSAWSGFFPRAFPPFFTGGGERIRTDGLLRARQALSQLSYTPRRLMRIRNCRFRKWSCSQIQYPKWKIRNHVVGLDGVEPSTSRLSGVRSNQAELQAHRNSELRIRISEYNSTYRFPHSKFRIQSGPSFIFKC